MNPYEELELKLLDEAQLKYNELKLKKLYNKHDIDKIKEEYENEIANLNGSLGDTHAALEKEKSRFPGELFVGIVIGLFIAVILIVIFRNQ